VHRAAPGVRFIKIRKAVSFSSAAEQKTRAQNNQPGTAEQYVLA